MLSQKCKTNKNDTFSFLLSLCQARGTGKKNPLPIPELSRDQDNVSEESVDAEKRPQQLNLFILGNYSANPSSNANMTAIFCTCQPENTVRIR
ncbi:hypothetical protein WN943_007869 [Citrus x changshan-huyou]